MLSLSGEVKGRRVRPVLVHPPQFPQEPISGKRKLAAILQADVVGFSRLMGEEP